MKLLRFLVCALLLLILTAGCQASEGRVTLLKNNRSDYTVVYPEHFLENELCRDALDDLEAKIRTNAAGAIALKSDFLAEGDSPGRFEILLGATNRDESRELVKALRCDDYAITFANGKLLVAGGSDEASAKAIRHLTALLFKESRKSLVLSEDFSLRIDGEYALDFQKAFTKEAKDVAILYGAATERDAKALQSGIAALTGYTLPTVSDPEGYSFLLTLTATEEDPTETENSLSLSHPDNAARQERVKNFLAELASGKSLATFAEQTPEESGKYALFSLDLYESGYGNNAIENRFARLMLTLEESDYPDLLAFQSASTLWHEAFADSADLISRYGKSGDGKNTVFYQKERFLLIESGEIDLSNKESRSPASCHYAILEDKTTRDRLAILSTELDSENENARLLSAKELLAFAKTLTCPIILAGDLHETAAGLTHTALTDYLFTEANEIAAKKESGSGITTNQGFGGDEMLTAQSDFVFTSYGDFRVKRYYILNSKENGGYLSSHRAIYLEFSINRYS